VIRNFGMYCFLTHFPRGIWDIEPAARHALSGRFPAQVGCWALSCQRFNTKSSKCECGFSLLNCAPVRWWLGYSRRMQEDADNDIEEQSLEPNSSDQLRVIRIEEIKFLSSVPAEMRHQVEDLFFFNLRQRQFSRQIQETVAKTGVPHLREIGGKITISLQSEDAQCLFACDQSESPVGCALYSRPGPDLIWVSYIATDPEVALLDLPQAGVAAILLDKILEIARSIRGVTRIQLPFRKAAFLPVQRARLMRR
jgi:hypothetical protein